MSASFQSSTWAELRAAVPTQSLQAFCLSCCDFVSQQLTRLSKRKCRLLLRLSVSLQHCRNRSTTHAFTFKKLMDGGSHSLPILVWPIIQFSNVCWSGLIANLLHSEYLTNTKYRTLRWWWAAAGAADPQLVYESSIWRPVYKVIQVSGFITN